MVSFVRLDYDHLVSIPEPLTCPMARTSIHTLVKEGWCWWYRKYALGDTVLEGLEKEAREGRKSLWADPQLVLPWAWRKRK